jgi:DNA-binding XRE family transcriptional regulator
VPSKLTGPKSRLKMLARQGAALAEGRARLGLTQDQAAKQWAVPLTTYRSWEHGLRRPDDTTLSEIAEAWSIDPAKLGIGRCPTCGHAII